MTTRKTSQRAAEARPQPCDNHPQRVTALSTTSDGAHSVIHLCRECARAAGRL
jgi:hypothetical protein